MMIVMTKNLNKGLQNLGGGDKSPNDVSIPSKLFFDGNGLFSILRRYKFTVEENTPFDQEIALDPELLGLVFENLLAAYNPETRRSARQATGSYYTPRDVVGYMVQEALTNTLSKKLTKSNTEYTKMKKKIEDLFDRSKTVEHVNSMFKADEAHSVIDAIMDLRVIDPAVGSGAFPMAVLQILVEALQKLDPDNQYKQRSSENQNIIDTNISAKKRLHFHANLDEKKLPSAWEISGHGNFQRKIMLIQNVIYGVDIQPVACQIAKLRFFISLLVEQQPNDNPNDNFGISPLPNLETQFVVADTLIRLNKEIMLRDKVSIELEKRLHSVRQRYFAAQTVAHKMKLRKEDREIRTKIKRLLEPLFGDQNAEAIADWDFFDQNSVAKWFDPEWMFGVADGFDVVIGNPPYISLRANGGILGRKYKNEQYHVFQGRGDIYQLFYERGCELLRDKTSTLVFITSNSWLKAQYGASMRKWVVENYFPLRIVEMGKDVFDASVDVAVFSIQRDGIAADMPAVDIEQNKQSILSLKGESWGKIRFSGNAPWVILSDIECRIFDKIYSKGCVLDKWNVHLNGGILTGCNEAFILDNDTKEKLVTIDPSAQEIIKPLLRGKDLSRWRPKWKNWWLICSHSNIDEMQYPAIREHLLQFQDKLLARAGSSKWWRLQSDPISSGTFAAFSQEKLFYMEMSPEGRFSYCEREYFSNDKAPFLTGNSLRYLCGILNSIVVAWFIQKTALTTGMGVPQWKKFVMRSIPVPRGSKSEKESVEKVVDQILKMKDSRRENQVHDLENKIDKMAFELYGFSETEREEVNRFMWQIPGSIWAKK